MNAHAVAQALTVGAVFSGVTLLLVLAFRDPRHAARWFALAGATGVTCLVVLSALLG